MIEYIVLGATYVVAFLLCIVAYEKGLKNGFNMAKGKEIQVTQNPVKTIVQAVETHKQNKEEEKLQEELTDIMSASKESMLEAIKKAR